MIVKQKFYKRASNYYLQASDGEEDNERSVRRFGYNPDNGDVWGEYQPAVGDPMFACYLDLHGSTI